MFNKNIMGVLNLYFDPPCSTQPLGDVKRVSDLKIQFNSTNYCLVFLSNPVYLMKFINILHNYLL